VAIQDAGVGKGKPRRGKGEAGKADKQGTKD